MSKKYDIAIIGAGVVGASIARRLSRYKLTVALLEKEVDVSFGTSKANSGIIHAGFHDTPGSLKAELCVRGNTEYDRLADELEFPFERRGELVVAFDEEQQQTLYKLYRNGQQNGVRYMELLGRERTLELEPNLNPDVLGSLYAPTAGIIGPYEYCFALVENAVKNGVELLLSFEVAGIHKTNNFFSVESSDGRSIESSFLVNAAGLCADRIAAMCGMNNFKITPRKGEEYLLDKRVGKLVRRVIFPAPKTNSKGILVIPTIDGPVMIGPTADDIDDKEDFSTTKEGLDRVFAFTSHTVPAIRVSDIITSFAGLRPVPSRNDFIIDKTEVSGFINAAGIQSPGLTASPAIAEKICGIILSCGLRMELNPDFNPKRKAKIRTRTLVENRDYDTLGKLIQSDKNYSKLVCRCENVSEAEIIDAIYRGHTTIDSIKYATRACSGRCQGGFCTSRILQLISEHAGIDILKITKKGPGSELILHRIDKGHQ
ncbi:MAG: NAD(P)/FAD-dependent oxidoreductase [Phycisphaerae bacterium]